MSSALKCDRCGKLYESYGGVQLCESGAYYRAISLNGSWSNQGFDLCEDCMKSLISWIKEADNE